MSVFGEQALGHRELELARHEIGEVLGGVRHLLREELVQPPVLGGHEAGCDAVARLADAPDGGGDVEVESGDRVRAVPRPLARSRRSSRR